MKKVTRIIVSILICLFVVGALLVLLDGEALNTYLVNIVSKRLSSASVLVSAEGLSLFVLGVTLQSVKITLLQYLLAFSINSVTANCLHPSLLWLTPRCSIHAVAYNGTIDADISTSKNSVLIHSASIKNLSLIEHPQVLGLGLGSGVLDAWTQNTRLENGKATTEKSTVTLKNVSIPKAITLSPRITQLPFAVVVPSLTIDTFSADISAPNNETHFSLSSSLGRADGKAASNIIRITLALSERGLSELRVPLSLLCSEHVISTGFILIEGTQGHLNCREAH